MGRKEQMKEKAQKHTEFLDRMYSKEIKTSVDATRLYDIDFIRNETAGKGKMAVLNFASYRHAGGGFLNGSMAQEEAICHSSFLYNILREFPEYYEWNEANYNKGLYMNRALYSPDVFFFP